VRALLNRMFDWHVNARWYIFAVSYMVVVKLTAAAAHRVIIGAWPAFGRDPWYLLPLAVAFSTPFQAGEEIGWRGYALPRMASRIGLAPASVILGIIWALWHLPLFYIPGTDTDSQPFLPYALSVTAMSVAFAWLYRNTRGSLLLVMLLHSAINNTKDIVPSSATDGSKVVTPMMWLTAAVLWVMAVFFFVSVRSKEGEKKVVTPMMWLTAAVLWVMAVFFFVSVRSKEGEK
jgi:membrane protease YdiL (CAAX protease family)